MEIKVFDDEDGGCYRYSVAFVLEIPPKEVPYKATSEAWSSYHIRMDKWLVERKVGSLTLDIDVPCVCSFPAEARWIEHGTTETGEDHCVVVSLEGEIFNVGLPLVTRKWSQLLVKFGI